MFIQFIENPKDDRLQDLLIDSVLYKEDIMSFPHCDQRGLTLWAITQGTDITWDDFEFYDPMMDIELLLNDSEQAKIKAYFDYCQDGFKYIRQRIKN